MYFNAWHYINIEDSITMYTERRRAFLGIRDRPFLSPEFRELALLSSGFRNQTSIFYRDFGIIHPFLGNRDWANINSGFRNQTHFQRRLRWPTVKMTDFMFFFKPTHNILKPFFQLIIIVLSKRHICRLDTLPQNDTKVVLALYSRTTHKSPWH